MQASPSLLQPAPTQAAQANPPRRLEPWPIGIAAFLAVFAAAAATYIAFAVGQRMDLVRPDYYEEEIRYQVQYDRLSRTRALGAEASLGVQTTARQLEVRIPASHAAALSSGTIQLYRPSNADSDQILKLAPAADGRQVVDIAGLEPGLWRAKVRWASGGLEYHLESSVDVPVTR